MSVNGQECYVELKTSPIAFNSSSYRRFIEQMRYLQKSFLMSLKILVKMMP